MTKLLSPYPESRRFLDKSVNLKNLIAINCHKAKSLFYQDAR